jgi:sugar diacid utilization regulator
MSIFLCNYNVKDNREEVSNVLSKYELMAGASYPFHKLEEMKERYQQAVEVMEIERNKDDSNIYFYDEKVFDIIAKTKDLCSQNNLINFCHPALWKIHNYDDKNNTALLETLEVYLSCERNLESTSKILQVHRNTVLQRLNKITELTNSYSFSADSLYNMYISIMLIRKNLCKHSNTRTANHK